jgi:ABC-type multidrug transport system ATPase subunit
MSDPTVPAAIQIARVTKRFGAVRALDDVTLDVPAGQTLVLWGANGAGKTTLLRCLLGLLSFDGAVQIQGLDVSRQGKAARRLVGYVPQDVRLPQQQTVEQAVAFFAALRGVPRAQAIQRLAAWGLDAARAQRVAGLSGGQRQRLALVLALLGEPPILLLDEPTSNLDLPARREFSGLLEQLQRSGKTLILSSHHAGEVWRLAERVVVLDRGRLIADGAPEGVATHLCAESMLELTVEAASRSRVVSLLQARGLRASTNGSARQVWVQVAAGRTLEPLRVLAEAQIAVFAVEVHSAPPTGGVSPEARP